MNDVRPSCNLKIKVLTSESPDPDRFTVFYYVSFHHMYHMYSMPKAEMLVLGLGLEHKVLVNNRQHAVDCQS